MPGKIGLGLGGTIMSSSSPAVVIEDYLWDLVSAHNLQPLASGTVSDFHDSWDLDGADYMPEVLPGDEGYWDNNETDLVTHGDFSSGTGWGGSGNVSGGQLTKTGSGLAYQIISGLQAGNEYIVVVDVETVGAANQVYLGGTSSSNLVAGVQTINIIAGSSNTFLGVNNGNTSTVINSISLVSNDIFPLDV